MQNEKIKNFTDLNAWKEGHKLVLMVYDITKSFPKEEVFGLISQMRRCVVSITSNIAEGFSRYSYREKAQFYSTSLGSVSELQNQVLIAKDVGIINASIFDIISKQTTQVHKIVNGLIKSSRNHNS